MRRTWEWTAASSSDHYTKERRKYGMQYYCYVYYDDNWQATYVGKGKGGRMYSPQGHPEMPPKDRIQVFYFEEDWEACECEIELIAFWGRQCDGGCLLNQTLGGKGTRGLSRKNMVFPDSRNKKISEFANTRTKDKNPFYGKTHSKEAREKIYKAKKEYWKNRKKQQEVI